MVNRPTLIAAVAVLLMALSAGGTWHLMSGKVDRLESELLVAESTIKSTNKALNVKAERLRELDRKYDQQSKELQNALQDNPEWAGARVPDSVFDSMFGSR